MPFSQTSRTPRTSACGPNVPLSPDILKRINLTSGMANAGLGMLKDGPKLRWPQAFLNAAFDDDRKQIEQNIAQALAQGQMGPVDLSLVGTLRDQVFNMGDKLKQMVQDVPAGQYMNGKQFLSELNASLGTLKDPNIANYFSGQYVARAANVNDLVSEMTAKGLRFAPAVTSDQPAYTAFYQSLLTYDAQMSQMASR